MLVIDTRVMTDHMGECLLAWIDISDTSALQTISYMQGELVYYTEVIIVEEDKENPQAALDKKYTCQDAHSSNACNHYKTHRVEKPSYISTI
jgi:hypothetical protein